MSNSIALSEKLDLSCSASLAQTLRDHTSDDLILDASQVTHFGALCLQVILAKATQQRAEGHELKLINANDKVIEQLRLMGTSPESIGLGVEDAATTEAQPESEGEAE